MKPIMIGKKAVGYDSPCFIVAEIGLNHNGSVEIAKQLIDMAKKTGCDAVKFQKRTSEICVPKSQWNIERDTPWGRMTYIEYRHKIEFGLKEYAEIDKYCRERDIIWFASPWDEPSVDFLEKFNPPCHKVPSACLTDKNLLKHIKSKGRPVILSTGMSTLEQIKKAVEILGEDNLIILSCVSTYPSQDEEINLKVISTLQKEFPNVPIGYSGHERGNTMSVCSVALGACVVERHITIDRTMWGSDQAASLWFSGLNLMVSNIRRLEIAMGDGIKKVLDSEKPIISRLRRVKDF